MAQTAPIESGLPPAAWPGVRARVGLRYGCRGRVPAHELQSGLSKRGCGGRSGRCRVSRPAVHQIHRRSANGRTQNAASGQTLWRGGEEEKIR